MFQRIKGAIDSRIAEEQARQKSTTSPISRSASTVRRSESRTESPATKPRRPKPKDDGQSRGPDPSEFEGAFVIEDDSEEPSRVGTPAITDEKVAPMADDNGVSVGSVDGSEKGGDKAAQPTTKSADLPQDVRTKLRKLEQLEPKYRELLRSYRIAHSRAVSIEPFEKVLKENTPISSIGDPDALVEYLNQLNLKGDMVMDELKRVSADRDEWRKKFEESGKHREELAASRSTTVEGSVATTDNTDTSSIDAPLASVKSPVQSVLGLFSPKQKAESTFDNKDVSEEFFSYDDEIPKLQTEVKERTAEVEGLKIKVTSLEADLAVAQETSSGLVENLEKASRELIESKEASSDLASRQEQIEAQSKEISTLKEKIHATETDLTSLKDALENAGKDASEMIGKLEGEYATHKKNSKALLESHEKARKDHESITEQLRAQIKDLESSKASDIKRIEELSKEVESLNRQLEEAPTREPGDATPSAPTPDTGSTVPAAGGAKKKNKKKKKGVNAAATISKDAPAEPVANSSEPVPSTPATNELQAEISRLKTEITDKDSQISKLQTKRKTEEDLREELESMQDNFLSIGQEHVGAKDKIKELQAEKIKLTEQIMKLESEIEGYKNLSEASEKADAELEALTAQYDDLKSKNSTLQTDVGAAQQLATSRYRDLTDLRDVLQKAQPELKALRAENAALKATKDELAARISDLRRLESRERDLKSDMTIFKKQAADRDNEVRTLNEKITQETNSRLRAEDQTRIAQRDMRKSDAEKIQLSAALEKSSAELDKVQEEAAKLRPRIHDLEDQVSKLTSETTGLRSEVSLRGTQYSGAQTLLEGMRSQTSELAMQLKEKTSQVESVDEELAEVQRLLNERTREGETMRRLLADVDDRADSKVREMRERMETAIEERDRAEDEASTTGRRRAREVDELKTKIRDFERELKRAVDDREELSRGEKELRRKRDEYEALAERARLEAEEGRTAMGGLQDALNGSEKQARDAERQRNELRRMLDEASARFEKQSREFKTLQGKLLKGADASSRSSLDVGRASSPAENGAGKMDYVYLKTILLQFLEQRDRKRQADLIKTVLGTLLHFDKKDQEKWIAVISAK